MKTKLLFYITLLCSFAIAQHPTWAWAKTAGSAGTWDFSGMGDQYTSTIATDKNGNSYVTGHFTGTAVFGTITVSSSQYPAVFTAKYDSSGNCLWVKHFGAHVPAPPAPMQMANNGKAIDIDSLGNCYVTGTFQGSPTDTIYFGSSKLVGYDDAKQEIFVVKYNTNGNEIWARQSTYWTGTGMDVSTSISVDKAGNSFTSFYLNYDNIAAFGSLPAVTGHGSYVVKYDASGNPQWTRQLGIGSGPPYGVFVYAIDNDETGNCYVTGALSGSATVGTSPNTTITALGILDTYVAKLNPNGTIAWVKQFGGAQSSSYGKGIGVDAASNLIVAANFNGTLNIGTYTLTGPSPSNSAAYDISFTKLDASGNVIWANKVGLGANSIGALKVTSAGNFYFAGTNNAQGLYCGNAIASNAALLVGKINALGSCQWVQYASSQSAPFIASGIGLDAQEDVYIAGCIQNTGAFGSHSVTSAGGYDVLVTKITTLFTNTVVTILTEENQNISFNIYPNPFETELFIELNGSDSEQIDYVAVYNLMGQEIRIIKKIDENAFVIKREDLPAGIYIFKLFAEKKLMGSGKLVAR